MQMLLPVTRRGGAYRALEARAGGIRPVGMHAKPFYEASPVFLSAGVRIAGFMRSFLDAQAGQVRSLALTSATLLSMELRGPRKTASLDKDFLEGLISSLTWRKLLCKDLQR